MLRTTVLLALIAFADSAFARMPKQYTIEQFLDTVSVRGASFSPDEKTLLLSTNQTGVFNVYTVPSSGGALKPITSSKESTFSVAFFPKDARILFSRDQGGNENSHLYVRNPDGSEKDLTPGGKTKAQFAGWTKDKSAFHYLTNARDPRFFDLYRMDTTGFNPVLIYEDKTGYNFGGISLDGKYIAFVRPKTTTDTDIFLYNSASRDMKLITPHSGEVTNSPEAFEPQSRYLYYTTNASGEFTALERYELSTGKTEHVEKANWDVSFCEFSENGKYRVTGFNEDGRTRIKIDNEATGQQVIMPSLGEGDVTSVHISPSENKMAFYFSGARSPANLYVYDLGSKQATRLTNTLNAQIDPADLVDSQVIRYPSFDALPIPALLYKPQQATTQSKAPAIVFVHGGPGGQARVGYSSIIQFLVNHGYVILDVNNRGSSGYGKTFFMADDRKHGREPLWDCIEAKKYLNSLGYVDPDKIGIMGGSYGGYMTLAALTLKPKEFKVGVDLFGVANWIRTLESIPPYWESEREALYREIGDPKKDRDMLMTISPLFHADQIERPLMVLQGANDPRVIKAESDDMVAAVKKKGGIVEYIVFPDEGHGFTKKANQIQGYGAILQFLDKYLKSA
ncbi:MAG: S9 family peptidase [Acidobacteriota bacterium]|nr:S9 family peptidase [Acidobacteriota bacterium]